LRDLAPSISDSIPERPVSNLETRQRAAHAFEDKPTRACQLRPLSPAKDEPTEPNNNGNVIEEDETEHWLSSVPEILESLAQSENDITAGHTYGEADVRAHVADMRAARADEQSAGTDDLAADVCAGPTAELVAVADALAGADREVMDDCGPRLICGKLPNSPLRMRTTHPGTR
jgi:hypothetical protein